MIELTKLSTPRTSAKKVTVNENNIAYFRTVAGPLENDQPTSYTTIHFIGTDPIDVEESREEVAKLINMELMKWAEIHARMQANYRRP